MRTLTWWLKSILSFESIGRNLAAVLVLIGSVAVLSRIAIGQETTAEDSTPTAPEIDAAALEQIRAGTLERIRAFKPDVVEVRGAVESVSASARCPAGYITNRSYRTSASDVEIVAETKVDCEGTSCRAIQIDARRDNPAPFDLSISLTCSE